MTVRDSKSVIFMIENPWSSRDHDRFGVDLWIARKWTVFIFDFTKIKHNEYLDNLKITDLHTLTSNLKVFKDNGSALIAIDELKGTCVFIDLLGRGYFENQCRKKAKKKGAIVKLLLSAIPSKRAPIFRKIRDSIFHSKAFFSSLERFIYSHFVVHPSYVVVGGTVTEQQIRLGKSKVIKAHNHDYDLFLDGRNTNKSSIKPYVLFLDEDVCYHPDYFHASEKPAASARRYFPAMNAGLEAIAKYYGLNLVVAAHPRSDYDKIAKCFAFPVAQNKTYELIKNASLIVAHGSTAIQMSVIHRKPIILVTTDELENSLNFAIYEEFRRSLFKSVVNFDHSLENIDWSGEAYLDENVYDNYFERYIKQSGSPEELVWKIVIDSVEQDFLNE